MATLLLWAALLAGIVILTPLADRLRIPLPVLLTVYGLALPLLPFTPALRLDPAIILPVVLPPLLFAATQRSTTNEFRQNARPILLLAVGLTVATAASVAWAVHLAGFAWGPAWVLGAVVAPPDPVAATAVARRLRLPERLVTVLEGEGMFNDATALVLYKLAVAAAVTGHISGTDVALRLTVSVVAGIGIGLLAGLLSRLALAALHDAAAETTVTVAMPFVVYLLAEEVQGSGVLAVLSLGLFLRSYSHTAVTSGGWLLGRAVWRYADYVITSLVFVLIGFELTAVLETSHVESPTVVLAAMVIGVVVVVRFAWMFPAATLARVGLRRRNTASPYGARETFVAAWAGMRGVVTVATALALPTITDRGGEFPMRAEIVFVGLACVLATLVVQGLTLAPLVRALKVGSEVDSTQEVAALRRRAAAAALDDLSTPGRGQDSEHDVPDTVRGAVTTLYEGYLAAQDALGEARTADGAGGDYSRDLEQLLRRASEIERDVVVQARRRGDVSAEAADTVLHDVEARSVRDLN
ncbi:MAG TPA: Na+/H+ antiporter [Dermatophilaceae bacterium]|nr:Na+/H+ antiporter [Dermatophilaceae bacterium]